MFGICACPLAFSLLITTPLSLWFSLFVCLFLLSRVLSFFPSFSSSSCWMDGVQLSQVQQLVPQEIADLGWTPKKSQISVLFHYSRWNTSSSQCHPEGKRCSTGGGGGETTKTSTAPSQHGKTIQIYISSTGSKAGVYLILSETITVICNANSISLSSCCLFLSFISEATVLCHANRLGQQ